MTPGRNSLELTYLPLVTPEGATSPLVSARGRYAAPRQGDDLTTWDMAQEVASAFALPGSWIDLDASQMDCFAETGEVSWPGNPLGLQFQEVEIAYTAGFAVDSRPDQVCMRTDRAQRAGDTGAERAGEHAEFDAPGVLRRHAG